MYVIIVYDMKEGRTDKPRKLLRQYITHVQGSVFEGEITKGDLATLVDQLQEIHTNGESIVVYGLSSENLVDREVIGEDPMADSRII